MFKKKFHNSIDKGRYGYLFIAPFFIVFAVFGLYPIVYTFILSFQKWDGLAKMTPLGWKNYARLLTDDVFYLSIWNTIRIWIFNFVPQMLTALLLSALFTFNRIRGMKFFRAAYYLPNLITAASVGLLFNLLFDGNKSVANYILQALHVKGAPFSFFNSGAFTSGMTSYIQWWMWFGYTTVIVMAGMVNPKSATVKVTFVDENGTEVSSWSHEKTVYDNWTRIWVPIAGDKGFDRTRIAKIKLGFYWQGNYAVDDLAFVGGYSDGIPQMNGNLVTNGSFEDDGSAVPVATGWNFEGGTPSATYLEKNSNAASGRFHLVHYSADAHDAYTWQAIYNLPNGTYTLKAMVQSGGGQKQNKILATDFGGSEMSVEIPVNSYWTQVEIGNINVTNGKCTIAFYTDGNAGDWSCVDNIEFYLNS